MPGLYRIKPKCEFTIGNVIKEWKEGERFLEGRNLHPNYGVIVTRDTFDDGTFINIWNHDETKWVNFFKGSEEKACFGQRRKGR